MIAPAPTYVLVCLEHPGRINPERLIQQDADLKVEAKWSGPVRGWYGTNTTLFGKMVATKETMSTDSPPVLIVTPVVDLPDAPNYLVETVSLGPIGASGIPTVAFMGGGDATELIPGTTAPAEARMQNGIVSAKIRSFDNVVGANYFAYGEWKFAVMSEATAKALSPGINVRGSFYSRD